MEKLKILITGGAGFIGSNIADYWTKQNAEVIVLDNLRTGKLENILYNNEIKFINESITNRDLVFSIMDDVDYIFHLAALVSVPESIINPFECIDINVKGLLNILDAAKEKKVKKIVFSSSAAVYGDNPISPKTTDLSLLPKSPYGITKLDGEYYLQTYLENFGLNFIALRYFNVFGPRQDPNSQYAAAIPIFINKALKDEDIIIYGDGKQTRDFIFIDDVVNANILAAGASVNGVYNVARGKAISINDIINSIIKITNSKSKIIYEEPRPGDIKHSLASIDKTKNDLYFCPTISLEEGLKKTIEYFKTKIFC
ncbi:MAG: SDR family oxidoreductase [Ignavibacterium sp.]